MKDRINKPADPGKEDRLQALKDYSDEQMREHGAMHWILNDSGEVTPASLMEWCFWYENSHHRVIEQDYPGQYMVSTIFTGLDMSYSLNPEHQPLVFETTVFGPEKPTKWLDGTDRMRRPSLWTDRCCTLAQAKEMHRRGAEWLNQYLGKQDAGDKTEKASGSR